jgi:16S rRNA (cytidine1402-2'-O)-methyltransferase
VLGSVDVIASEDTRRTRALLSALQVPAPRLIAYHDHNERASSAGIVELLTRGQNVAVVSDAGTPGVADPGMLVVAAAREAHIDVVSVAGPSAVSAAVSVSGFGADGYTFVGFLPRNARELRALLVQHAHQVLVAFETPARIEASLAVVQELQPTRQISLSRELTKQHEQTVLGDAQSLAERAAVEPLRGEIVLVLDAIEGAASGAVVDSALLDLIDLLVEEGLRVNNACRLVAKWTGIRKGDLYDSAVARRGDGSTADA